METKAKVIDEDGRTGRLLTELPTDGHEGTVTVALDQKRQVVVPTECLSFDNGTARLEGRFEDFELLESGSEPGADRPESGGQAGSARAKSEGDEVHIPVAHEEVSVDRRQRTVGRVRIDKRVEREEVAVDEQVEFDEVDVERVPVNRVVDELPSVRREGDTLIVPVLEERLVKQTVLVEEVRVTRRGRSEQISEPVTLRREEVDIERERFESDSDRPPPSS